MARVLVIERHVGSRSMSAKLRQREFDVVELTGALHGWPGLYQLRDESFQLVILDEELATLDGLELLPAIKHLTEAPVMVIGSGTEESAVQTLLGGADAYLPRSAEGETAAAYAHALLRRHPMLVTSG